MNPELVYIIIACSVAMFVWGVSRVIFRSGGGRERISQRLSLDGQLYTSSSGLEKSILIQSEVTGLAAKLIRQSFFFRVQRQLIVINPKSNIVRFLILSASLFTATGAIAFILTDSTPVAFSIGFALGYFPFMRLNGKIKKRQKMLNEQLPEALDFLSRILRSGHSLTTGLQMMGSELPEPLASEFRRCYDQHSLGSPLDDCLKDTAERVDSTDFRFFVTAVLIQRQTGGDLSQVLGNISGMVRGRIRLASYVRAKTAEGRFTGYILVGFPMLMFFIAYGMNPDYAGKLLHTSMGQKLMATAVGLQILGLVSIRKITDVRV
jgi:tight adherence protein B